MWRCRSTEGLSEQKNFLTDRSKRRSHGRAAVAVVVVAAGASLSYQFALCDTSSVTPSLLPPSGTERKCCVTSLDRHASKRHLGKHRPPVRSLGRPLAPAERASECVSRHANRADSHMSPHSVRCGGHYGSIGISSFSHSLKRFCLQLNLQIKRLLTSSLVKFS